MLTAVIGVVAALIFGSADFLGGMASRYLGPLRATAVAAWIGLIILLVAQPFVGGSWSASALLWGGLSGVTGALAISLLYACLAVGPMSILSPLTAVVSAIVPMTWGLAHGDRFTWTGYLALGLALVAVVLVGFVPEKGAVRPSGAALLMAVGSGLMIGAFLILIDLAPDDSGLVPLIANRAVNGVIMVSTLAVLAGIAARRRSASGASASVPSPRAAAAGITRPLRIGLAFAIGCGVVDALANALLLLGVRIGDLSVIAVLTALYPAGTVLLAATVLRERIAPVQWAGLVLALAAAGMLALA
ncbi:MAG TPA: EamA family transporter [Humibacter sp.]|nr:EamA family transporter [Humibacter sp.]